MNKSLSNVLKSEVSDRTWITRITVLAAAVATIAGTTLAFGQDKKDGFDRPLNGEQAEAEQDAQGESTSTTYMSFSENGKQYSVEARDGKIARVELDGKRLSKDRWRYDGKKLEILDEKGEVEKTIDMQMGGKFAPGAPRLRVFQGDREALRRDANRAFEELRKAQAGQRGQQNWRNLNGVVAPPAEEQPKVMLGITFSEVGEEEDGVVVDSVVEGLPADKAGLKEGDVILKVGDKEVLGNGTFRSMLRDFKPDDKVDMTVLRDGQKRTVTLVFEAYDAEKLGNANAFAFPGGDGVFVMPGQNELGLAERERMGQLFGLANPFGGADRAKIREQFDEAREELQKAIEKFKTIDKVDFDKARDEATKSLNEALESLESLQEKLSAGNLHRVWTTTPRGDVLVTPTPLAPATTIENSADMKKLLEKLEQLETKVEELQKKKE
ncbi:MAG: PDZ domain-containing protein [Phycisphaerales bacterium]